MTIQKSLRWTVLKSSFGLLNKEKGPFPWYIDLAHSTEFLLFTENRKL
jgi:hypothetical protein